MPIPEFKRCDLFSLNVEALVNPVNCVGTMGKGLALEFKKRFPLMFNEYARLCGEGKMKLGEVQIVDSGVEAPAKIILFPTKYHWNENSLYVPIVEGLQDMKKKCEAEGIKSVGVPALGCGLGGLQWDTMKGALRRDLLSHSDIRYIVAEPIPKIEV
jgi:O-acetyl-ADP-ribose deacetylase (regulator of RNase III)